MCGRFALYTPPDRLARMFEAEVGDGLATDWTPSWNVAPSQRVVGVVESAPTSKRLKRRALDYFQWGLIPSWSNGSTVKGSLFNARCETVATKPSFRSSFSSRRMIVIADGFYEWSKSSGSRRVPYYFFRTDGTPMALAGLWERPIGTGGGKGDERLPTCTIVTTRASIDVAGIHDRMPVILDAESSTTWLDTSAYDRLELEALLKPAPPETVESYRVSAKVNRVLNDTSELINPLPAGLFEGG